MKKKIIITIMILLVALLLGCTKQNNEPKDKLTISIATLKGPTGMGMIKLIEDNEKGTTANNYEFTLAGSPDEITGKIITGEIKIAALPINPCCKLIQ